MAYMRPTSTLPAHDHFARDAICVAYKRYLGIHRRDDTEESMQRFAEVMSADGTESFMGKSRTEIVQILKERTAASDTVTSAQVRGQ
jgi:hypothetical protein